MINSQPIIILLTAIILSYFFYYFSPVTKTQTPFHSNINTDTIKNQHYRHVIYTTDNFQLVLMSLRPQEEIGMEVHSNTTQFIRVEEGQGIAIIDNQRYPLEDDIAIVIPPNANHNIINTHSSQPLKLYVIYTPPEHPENTLQPTKPKNDHHH